MTPNHDPAPLATRPPPGRIQLTAKSLVSGTRHLLGAKPVALPVIDRQLTRLPPIERAAEVLRYSVLRAEHWVSPHGTIRAILRLSLKVALLLGLPVIFIGPVVLLLLDGMAAATAALAIIAANLASLSISLLVAVIGFAVLAALGRSFLRRR